jgi:hypothetical protein
MNDFLAVIYLLSIVGGLGQRDLSVWLGYTIPTRQALIESYEALSVISGRLVPQGEVVR